MRERRVGETEGSMSGRACQEHGTLSMWVFQNRLYCDCDE